MPREKTSLIQCRVFLFAVLPGTVLLLLVVSLVQGESFITQEVLGILAIAIGLSGILLFYVHFYKLLQALGARHPRRWFVLAEHAGSIALLYLVVQWLGSNSPWNSIPLWGNYDLSDACKVFVIGILVVGTISLIGSMIALNRQDYSPPPC